MTAYAHLAARVLKQPEDKLQVLDTRWNGRRAIFADHLTSEDELDHQAGTRALAVLLEQGKGLWEVHSVASVEVEGGSPEIAAIGFANADKDAAQELIVLIKWPQVHYDYGGDFYDVQLYDTPKAGQIALPYLAKTSKLFGGIGCECMYRDGRESTQPPFVTIDAIKRKLAASGY